MKELVIIFGGKSCEHDISIITAAYAYHAINLKEYRKTQVYLYQGLFYIGKGLESLDSFIKFDKKKFTQVIFSDGYMYAAGKKLKKLFKVDCALLCTHGGEGEDGALQGYFEINKIPYSSSGVAASAVTMDKVLTKKLLESYGYDVLPYAVLAPQEDEKTVKEKISYPVIVKPARLGSSIGISKAKNFAELVEAVELGRKYDDFLLVESCLEEFIELNCAAVKNGEEILVSGIERPYVEGGFLSYNDKYICGAKAPQKKEFPAKIDEKLAQRVADLTKSVYKDFRLTGVVRVDYLAQGERLFVNEINSIPGSLGHYLFAKTVGLSGIVKIMADEAARRYEKEKNLITSFYSNVLTHYKGSKAFNSIKK